MKKVRSIKNTWYDWLINYIPGPIRKSAGGFKDKTVSFFNTNTPKQTVYGRVKKQSKPKTQNKISNIRNSFILKRRKNIKDRIIRGIRTLFELEEEKDYYKLKKVSNICNNNYIEYESNGDKNRNLSLEEYLNNIEILLEEYNN